MQLAQQLGAVPGRLAASATPRAHISLPAAHLLARPGAHGARLAQCAGAHRHHTGAQGAHSLPLSGTPAGSHKAQHGAARLVVGAPVVDLSRMLGGRAHGLAMRRLRAKLAIAVASPAAAPAQQPSLAACQQLFLGSSPPP